MNSNLPLRTARPIDAELKPMTVIPRAWRSSGGRSIPGAKIKGGRGWIFVPAEQLRAVADGLHDVADGLEGAGLL